MKKFLWYLTKWILGTPIMMIGGVAVIVVGTIIILWGATIVVIAPVASMFAEITLEQIMGEDQDQSS